jgi:hypothetical protein
LDKNNQYTMGSEAFNLPDQPAEQPEAETPTTEDAASAPNPTNPQRAVFELGKDPVGPDPLAQPIEYTANEKGKRTDDSAAGGKLAEDEWRRSA